MRHWIDRQRYLVDFTLTSLKRRKAKVLGLFAVYSLVVFALASAMLFASAVRREAGESLRFAPDITVQRIQMGRHALTPQADLQAVRGIRGVRKAHARLWGYFYDRANGANYLLMVPPEDAPEWALNSGEVILGEGVARSRDLAEGGAFIVVSQTSRVLKGRIQRILSRESALVSSDLVLVSEEDFRQFFGLPAGVYTDLALEVRNSREIDTIIGKASIALPESRFVARDAVVRTYASLFDWREGILLVLGAVAVLAFAIFAAEKASGLSAEEVREIGVLKALGWDTGDVLAMKLWEGTLIAFGAFLAGFLLAYVHVFVLGAGLLAPVLKGWSVIYPDMALIPALEPLQITALFVLSVLPYIAATLVPVWRSAIADPDEVMR